MLRLMLFLMALLLAFWALAPKQPERAYDADLCAGPPLTDVVAINDAMEKGYVINQTYRCIDKKSFEQVEAQHKDWEQKRQQRLASERTALAKAGKSSLSQARHGFETAIKVHDPNPLLLPNPRSSMFVRSDYKNPQNYTLPAYVSPDPGDGQKHPAIIWLTGGDTNSLSDFWSPGPPGNDQSARAFREAGIVMMFPTLRGGNTNSNAKEYFLGEVDDVIKAAEQLAKLTYVDPQRIYLGGHSTGGTLALLVAEMGGKFNAIFAFGPVASVDSYPATLLPVAWGQQDPQELILRSPIHWLAGIQKPTFIIEGMSGTSNGTELERLCAKKMPQLNCVRVSDANHFSVLGRITPIIAEQILADEPTGIQLNEGSTR